MEIYYEDYRLKVVKNELGKYDVYDSKYGGRKTYKDKSKDFVDEKISNVLSKRSIRKITQIKK